MSLFQEPVLTSLDDIGELLNNGEATTPAPPVASVPATPTAPRRRGRPPKSESSGAKQPEPRESVKAPKPEIPMPKAGVLADAVANLYVYAGMGLMSFRPETAMALANSAQDCGKAWEELAKSNPAVRRVLLSMLQTSAWGGLAMAHMPIVMAIMAEGKKANGSESASADSGSNGTENPVGSIR